MSHPILDESTLTDDGWVHKCGTTLLSVTVTHSIHDGPGPLSGGGQVHSEMVPYCPNCQKPPSTIGAPLKEDPRDVSEREILRRMRDNR
ncbi:MAG TPA: hypothetical protein VLE72_01395 [Candidatus Saccharimonadales bacterium]|nr:hypothetical protein [Candidatus Saccharimonadales bacterium]